MDRSWIKNQHGDDYLNGIELFLKQASENLNKKGRTECPCTKCTNMEYRNINDVKRHLINFGMEKDYTKWVHHGEPEVHSDDSEEEEEEEEVEEDEETKKENEKLFEDLVLVRDLMDKAEGKFKNGVLAEAERPLYPGCRFGKLDFVVKLLHTKANDNQSDEAFDAHLGLIKMALPNGDALPKSFIEAKALIEEIKRSQDEGL